MKPRAFGNIFRTNRDSLSKISMLWGNSYVGQAISFLFVILLIRDLALQGFGLYAIGLAFVTAGALVVDFGASTLLSNWVAAGRLKGARGKSDLRTIRLCLSALVLILAMLAILIFSFPSFYLVALAVGVLSVFEESWLLQAEGKVRQYVIADVVMRLVTLLTWVVVSRFDATPLMAILSVGCGFIARSIYTGRQTDRSEKFVTIPREIKRVFKASTPIAAAKALNSSTNQLTPLMFGLASTLSTVGTFTSAEKPIRALQAGANSYAAFALPKISIKHDSKSLYSSILRHLATVCALAGALALAIYFAAPILSLLLVGLVDSTLVSCIQIMALVPIFTSINNLLTVAVTPAIGKTYINLVSGLIGLLVLCAALVSWPRPYTAEMMAFSILLIELSIAATTIILTLGHLQARRRKGIK